MAKLNKETCVEHVTNAILFAKNNEPEAIIEIIVGNNKRVVTSIDVAKIKDFDKLENLIKNRISLVQSNNFDWQIQGQELAA